MIIRSYNELRSIKSFTDRFEYLKLGGLVGQKTFGVERYLNQRFYTSKEWKQIRNEVIVRDNGCDLAHEDFEIAGRIIVHHMNPISIEDIELCRDCLFDLNNLICTSHITSEAIHYGDAKLLPTPIVDRRKGDTSLWQPMRRVF